MCIANTKISIALLFFVLFTDAIVFASDIDPSAFYVNKDHPGASNANPGTALLPWKSIQHGVNQLTAGQRLYVRESVQPYFEPYRFYGTDTGGITIDVSGTPTNKIYIEGYPGDSVIINQNRGMSKFKAEDGTLDNPNDSKPLSGFYIRKGNYIVIKNFEITQCFGSCIMFDPALHNLGVEIEGNNIHHAFAMDNIGGIRLDHADNAIVRNNIIHDIYSTRRTSNAATNEPYGLDSGIHGYEPGNALIEYNVIYNVDRGIFAKASDRNGLKAATVRRNLFFSNTHSAFSLEIQGSGSPPALNAEFYENIVYNSRGGVSSDLGDTNGQSTNFKVYNNTFYNLDYGVGINGVIGVEIHSNIFSNINGMNISTSKTARPVNKNKLIYVDNNLYFNEGREWGLEVYESNNEFYRSLAAWKQSFTSTSLNVLVANPDINSVSADPEFTDLVNLNFTVKDSSPASIVSQKGRYNKGIGAYGMGAVIIGISGLRPKAVIDLN